MLTLMRQVLMVLIHILEIFNGEFVYNFTGLGLVLDTVNTVGSRRNKLNTTLKYNSDDYSAIPLFNHGHPIMLPLEQNIYSTTISQSVANISSDENKLLKLENDLPITEMGNN